MRIVFLIHDLKTGGAERQLAYLCEGLDRQRFQPAVITMMDRGPLRERLRNAGIPLYSLNLTGRSDFLHALPRLVSLLRELRPRLLHTWLWYADLLGRLAARRAGVPFLVNSMRNTDDWRRAWHMCLDRWTAGRADLIVANSLAGARRLVTVEGIPAGRIRVIHNGIDAPSLLRRQAAPGTLRRELGIRDEDPLVGCVGRLHRQKNIPLLLAALTELLPRHPRLQLVLFGDGPERQRLENLAERPPLAGHVHFRGEDPDPASRLKDLDLQVLSSDYEGLPNVLLEGGLMACPVVATAVGGVPELIRHEREGLLVQPGDRTALAAAMDRLLHDRGQAQKLGHALAFRVRDRFSLERLLGRHENLYEELAGRRRVLLFVTKSDVGGAQKHVADLATGLPDHGWEADVAAGTGGELFDYLHRRGVQGHFLPSLGRAVSPLGDLQAAAALYALLRRERFDLMHCHSSKAGLIGRLVGRLAGVPTLFTAHGFVFHAGSSPLRRHAGRQLEALAARMGQGLITVSHHDASLALDICPADRPLRVIANGIDAAALRASLQDREELRRRWGIDDGSFVFGSVGRFCREKAFDLLIPALKQAAPFLRPLGARVLLCGEGPEKGPLQETAVDEGIDDLLRFLPGPSPASPWYAGFDAYLLPSRKEGCPYTLLEAGATGLPVLASRVGGVPDLIDDGLSGRLIPVENPEALAAGLVEFLRSDRERLAGWGRALRRTVDESFTLEAMNRAVATFYDEVLSGE